MTAIAPLPARLAVGHWQKYGICTLLDDDAAADFFPDRGGGCAAAYARARAHCLRCPVQLACFLDAVLGEGVEAKRTDRAGMQGGTTPQERSDLAAKLAALPVATWAPVARGLLTDLNFGRIPA